MRIRELRIDGFGQFAKRQFGALKQPVTVFFGPNEAGKSTLLEFVRRVLFGFPRKSGKVNAYPALAGGNYGGHVAIECTDGRVYDVRRTTGKSYSGDVGLTSATGDTLPETELASLLGHNSRDVFERVFAFTLNDLYSDDLLSDANVNSQIYSAGMGVTSLPDAEKFIESSRTGIFLKGGSTQKIYEIYNSIEKVDDRLREVADNATRFGELTERLQGVEGELGDLAAQQLVNQSRYNRQITLQNAWDDWNDLITATKRRNELTEIGKFPRNGVGELEKLENLAVNAREEFERSERHMKDIQARADRQIDHEAILEQSSQVRDIERRRSAFDQSVKDIPERQAELAAMRVDLDNTLADLGKEWDVHRLNGFDLSIVVREKIASFGHSLGEAREVMNRAKGAVATDQTALEEAGLEFEHAKKEFDNAPRARLEREEIRQKRRRVVAARDTLTEFSRSEERARDLRDQLEDDSGVTASPVGRDWSKFTPSVIGGAALIVLGLFFAITDDDWGSAVGIGSVVLGVILVGASIYVFALGRPLNLPIDASMAVRIRRQHEEAEERSTQFRKDLSEHASLFGIDSIDLHSLEAIEDSLNVEESRLNELDQLEKSLDEIKSRVVRREARYDDSKQELNEAECRFRTIEDEWRTWLRERGLLETFSPENIEVLRGLVDLGRTHYTKVTQMKDRIAAILTDIRQFIELVHPLATAHGFEIDRNDWAGVADTADELIELHASVQDESRKRDDALDELRAFREEFAGRKDRLAEIGFKIEKLLAAAGTHSREEFLRMADVFDEREELEERNAKALEGLQRLSGPGEPLEMLKSDLGSTNPQAITDEMARLEEERTAANDQRERLSTERGSIQTDLDGLIGEEESSRLRMERNVLLEQIQDHAREWTRLTLARNLLDEARRKFEQERQPGVVRHAQKFFTAITGGRYRQVYAPLGEQTITVTDADGRTKQPSELSRGTREQLFLSLRFGLIRELGERTEPLPVVVDEVLVNFDPDRALRAAVAFTELSKTNQVLVFTCHPTVVELFRNAASETRMEKPEVVQIR
ncbi:MAG: AAA family ATPase [Candidatus Latescibacteria bacterium]|nr:AAA family ATPase [Candidatus Latescibacterota bacterium]